VFNDLCTQSAQFQIIKRRRSQSSQLIHPLCSRAHGSRPIFRLIDFLGAAHSCIKCPSLLWCAPCGALAKPFSPALPV
jgi:hypothetical protein